MKKPYIVLRSQKKSAKSEIPEKKEKKKEFPIC